MRGPAPLAAEFRGPVDRGFDGRASPARSPPVPAARARLAKPPATMRGMSSPICPVCAGPTFEIRAKLVCRQCGMILETCCEGGPMAGGCTDPADGSADPAAPPARPESSHDFPAG